jgi:hypothetical protein
MVESKGRHKMIFVGVDWAEAHNDVLVMDEGGVVLDRGRFSTGVTGLAQLHALVADCVEEPGEGGCPTPGRNSKTAVLPLRPLPLGAFGAI